MQKRNFIKYCQKNCKNIYKDFLEISKEILSENLIRNSSRISAKHFQQFIWDFPLKTTPFNLHCLINLIQKVVECSGDLRDTLLAVALKLFRFKFHKNHYNRPATSPNIASSIPIRISKKFCNNLPFILLKFHITLKLSTTFLRNHNCTWWC